MKNLIVIPIEDSFFRSDTSRRNNLTNALKQLPGIAEDYVTNTSPAGDFIRNKSGICTYPSLVIAEVISSLDGDIKIHHQIEGYQNILDSIANGSFLSVWNSLNSDPILIPSPGTIRTPRGLSNQLLGNLGFGGREPGSTDVKQATPILLAIAGYLLYQKFAV